MRVDAAPGGHALRAHQRDLTGGGDVEPGAEVSQRRDDRRVRQRLQRIEEPDTGQRRRELAGAGVVSARVESLPRVAS
jgi:hypothetical protein